VDRSILSGHLQMMWDEFFMLLENDAVIGSESPKLSDADQTFQMLTQHINRLRRQFALYQMEQAAETEIRP